MLPTKESILSEFLKTDQGITPFSPAVAFSRNLGWLTEREQEKIFNAHVGIAGLGGVGGQYAETLARLGVGEFTICDADAFEIENSNRQNECRSSNYGKNKAQVIGDLIQDINPKAKVHILPGHLTEYQVKAFCKPIDVYFDGLDFFALEIRQAIFLRMRILAKPAITAAPIGTGSSCLIFTKDSMSFDDYFGLHTTDDPEEKSARFLLGLAPSLQQMAYFQDRSKVDLKNRRVPSLPMGVYACASMAVSNWMKIVTGRGRVLEAPYSSHFDPFLSKLKITHLRFGHRNPAQKIKLMLLKRQLKAS